MADTTTKQKRNRSTAYPAITLEKAVEATKQLRDNLGAGPYSRDSAAIAHGYANVSGASGQKISACVHFGLLVRANSAYKQSDLANQVFRFLTEKERQEALRTAVQKPALYTKLITEFNGKALPKMLDNLLVRNYGITERVAKDAATVFVKSLEYAGVLQNGIVVLEGISDDTLGDGIETIADEQIVPAPSSSPPSTKTHDALVDEGANSNYLPVAIPDTKVKILFPMDYAYDLGVGSFKEGIEALTENIKQVRPVLADEEPSTTA